MPTRPGERHLRYVRPSSMALGVWDAGADWTSPTSLSFDQEVLQAEDYAASITISPEVEWPPHLLVAEIERLYGNVAAALDKAGRVVDAGERAGVRLVPDRRGFSATLGHVAMGVRVKTWPAVPGVTAPAAPHPEMSYRPASA
jgi:hypothetical protein